MMTILLAHYCNRLGKEAAASGLIEDSSDHSHDSLSTSGSEHQIQYQEEEYEYGTEAEEFASDVLLEASSFQLNAWRKVIQDDAFDLWTSPEASKIWEFYSENKSLNVAGNTGRSPSDISEADRLCKAYCAHTFAWVRSLLTSGMGDLRAERVYRKYRRRFEKVKRAYTRRMKKAQFERAVERYNYLVTLYDMSDCQGCLPGDVICSQIAVNMSNEDECVSLIYLLLRQRPDLIVNASRERR